MWPFPKRSFALLAGILLALPAVAQEGDAFVPSLDETAVPGVMEKAVDGFIRPGYHAFLESARILETDMAALCATPDDETLGKARQGFEETVRSWSRIEIVRVGPVIEQNRFERILFYPDRKSTGLKQVQAALAKNDETTTSVETLKDKSVAMQGLGALEFILYGTGNEELTGTPDSYRCRYGKAIAGNLVRLGSELTTAWDDPQGVSAAWKAPGPDNPVYRDAREAVTGLLGVLVHGAEAIRDQRLETFYRGPDAAAFPKQAIYWRSGLTFVSISENLTGLDMLLKGAGMADLLDPGVRSIVTSIDFVLKSLIRISQDIDPAVDQAVSAEKPRAKLDFLLLNSRDLIVRLNDGYGGAIGLGAGFSFSDGD
ncbi:hypothetical protein J5J10_16675 [Ciceribacter sp. L1K23]|uniref:imelysin family protein n=1 Tax=unclassified Ciceribacter TaxID=2628820 RepID=UPI001ABEB928|nr:MULTISPECIES: imelysin family protein [unclassified Ciceribacter]MBO3758727.1 hypothetical protein [Ciceribacter sp. L1K22]MBR0557323.1 hypothetical protein [Ciceribacter sp. L1K23]